MKKCLILFSAIVLFANVLLAQDQQPPQRPRMTVEERAKQTTEWMKKELSLTDAQIAPVDSINLLYTKTQQTLRQSAGTDREKIREAMVALETQKVEAFKTVLTPEQVKLYQEKSQEMANSFRSRDGQGGQRQRSGNREQQ